MEEVRYVFVTENTLYDRVNQCAVSDASPQYLAWVAEGNVADPLAPPPVRYAGQITVNDILRTTDAAPAEVFRVTTLPKHLYRGTFSMMAVDTVSGASKDVEARLSFKQVGGAATQVGATVVISAIQDAAASTWGIQGASDGLDFVISVRGASGRTIDWGLTGTIAVYAPEGLTEG